MHPQRTIRAVLSLGLRRFLLPIGVALSLVVGVAIGAVIALGVTAGQVAAATVDDEQAFVQQINDLRAAKGLNALTVDAELTAEARSWAAAMASSDSLSHSPDMAKGISAQWTVLGENVGVHSVHNLPELFQAFVNSPAHYRNLVDDRFQYVGVGVVHDANGKLWTTHRFMAAEPPPSAPLPVIPQTTTTTTTPPAKSPQTSPPTTEAPQTETSKPTQPPSTAAPATSPTSGPAAGPTANPTANPTGNPTANPTGKPDSEPNTPSTTQPTRPPNSNPSAEPYGIGPADQSPAIDDIGASAPNGTDSGTSTGDRFDAERNEIAERVQPDPETVEHVLNELVLAGI